MTVVPLRPTENPPLGYEYLDGELIPALDAARRRATDRPTPDPVRIAQGLALAKATLELAQTRRHLRTTRRAFAVAIAAAILAWFAGPSMARAALPTDVAGGRAAAISVTRIGPCGSGGVVVGDGCSTRSAEGLGYGQGMAGGTNSQDIGDLRGWIIFPRPVDTVWFTVQDAHDQLYTKTFKIAIGGHRYEIAKRQANGAQTTFMVRLGRAVRKTSLRMLNIGPNGKARTNDGFSFRACW